MSEIKNKEKNPKTLFDKVWEKHVITGEPGEAQLLYIDLHLIHEVTSPQAFSGLRIAGRKVRRPDLTFGTMDHNTPTIMADRMNIKDKVSKAQLDALSANCKEFGIELVDMFNENNGIVHMVGPEQGLTQPGKTVVCGDSHTATHGAFGALAFGIGTSEVEHVLATQTIWQKKPKTMGIEITGELQKGVYAKDIILHIIKTYGIGLGNGYAFEFFGDTIRNMSMEGRMTICNMAIEGGGKSGIIAPDETTFEYVKGRRFAPKGEEFDKKVAEWKELYTDSVDAFDKYIKVDVSNLEPQVTWVKHVFIGSCTNGRLADLEIAAKIVKGKKVAPNITAVVVPGSQLVKKAAEENGIAQIFKDAGFEWREAGCSTCLGMNPDLIPSGEHCASTSNRNFEGRQGKGARTHLVSPAMAAAAAIYGKFMDVRELDEVK